MMELDTKIALGIGILLGGPIILLILVGLFPLWFLLQGSWDEYLYWFKIMIWLSRLLYGVSAVLLPFQTILTRRWTNISNWPGIIIMAIWGVPVLARAIISLISQPLGGLELQRTILQIIIIKCFALSIIATTESSKKEDDS